MSRKLVIRPESCIGCRCCALVCSYAHGGTFSPKAAAVGVIRLEDHSVLPLMCMHCEEPECVKACPTGALERDERTGAVILDEKKCISCGSCATVCSLGNIHRYAVGARYIKCDLCGGAPRCAEICPAGAIDFIEPGDNDLPAEGV